MTKVMSIARQTLDQRRAHRAWQVIQMVVEKYPFRTVNGKRVPHEQAKKFGGQAKQLPTRIMAAGLGQALGFLRAKDYTQELQDDLGEWICERIPLRPGESRNLLDRIIMGDSDFLRRATDEVLVYLVWLIRFAEAEGLMEGEDQ